MNLIEILSAKYIEAEPSTAMACTIIADVGEGPEELIFIYRPEDPYGLNPDVTAWFFDNPDFEIAPYKEPEPEPAPNPLTRTLTKRQVTRAMVIGAGIEDPDAFVENAIKAIPDVVARGLALADWRYAPYFQRYHDLFANPDLLAATGMTSTQIDALWALGLDQPE